LNQGDAKAARKEEVEKSIAASYSMGAQIALMLGLCVLHFRDYDSCIGAATRYVTLHPGSADAAYAHI